MTSLPEALATLVAWRDRLTEAVGALSPLLTNGAAPPELVELPARPIAALAAPAKTKPGRKLKRATTGKGLRPRIGPEVIAKIQKLAAEGKGTGAIAAACGVSAPTAAKYAKEKPKGPTGLVLPAAPKRVFV